jgi:hydroxyethylthiazole kinase-like uncharacterized protein yjeF
VRYSHTTAQIRAAERYHLARTAPDALMRRAARAVADAVIARLPSPVPGRSAALLVGAGNNGGDALFAGADLRRRGMAVTAVLTDSARAHPGGLAALRRAGGRVLALQAEDPTARGVGSGAPPMSAAVTAALARADAIVDGLVGLGASPPLRPVAAALVAAANAAAGWRVAVDLPSGIDPDTGREVGPAFRADITVTFGGMKTALLFAPTAGRVEVADIGMIPDEVDARILTDDDAARLMPQPGAADDKFSLGVTGVLAGSARYPGAAILSVGGAVAARPGLVRYVGPCAADVLRRWPEAIAVREFSQVGRVQAWVAGPGMGTDGAALGALRDVLATDLPVLVDADGLTLLAQAPVLLVDRARRGVPTVLTPHAGEFARLFPDLDPEGPNGRLAAVRAAAARSGAVVLLKGHRTVVAGPGGDTMINLSGLPQLATAGSGDVLSGLAGALLSAGLDGVTAAALAAHRHGRAGERAAAAGRAGASALLDHLASPRRGPSGCDSIGV